ncbi:multicopper oxidase [Suillus luteus UH-Slu-Lm8-n1]|uniref:Multicopper oxidase n=1 Tax=Suillus luteus UH-Slu-Lm8-n1 TaxID=930992 RepID=A0A0D0A510_9AGAM|nr:multicopper oxidase [Suillus luteus UH-Slu-Lm8-n1]
MFILFLVVSLILSIHATSVVSRSQSYPLSQPDVHGPKIRLIIGNGNIAPDGLNRSAILVDGVFPGPLITAQKGDHFDIEVVNNLTDDSMFQVTSVHWHGISQKKTNYADGTSFVTQCPITPNHSFLYSFSAQHQAGTFWYHSHYSCDGLRGPLVIYDPKDPTAYMYDVDDASTVITLADWYHVAAPLLRGKINTADSMLINGLGRYAGAPNSDLAVISVEHGKRYRLRLIQMSCDSNVLFSIDGHELYVIEADGQLTAPLLVDQLQIFAGQRYSVVLVANKTVDNYWIRGIPNSNGTYTGTAILRYKDAPKAEPTTVNTPPKLPLQETNLHALINPGAPGTPRYGNADYNYHFEVSVNHTVAGYKFYVNNVTFQSPFVPVLLQILNGHRHASELLPHGSVYLVEANQVVELTVAITGQGGPHPMHLHGHTFNVIQSAGDRTLNYMNPVRRDVVNAGSDGQQMVIRWVTDNSGPWIFHCHIDWHLDDGLAVVFAEKSVVLLLNCFTDEWDRLCPIYDNYIRITPTSRRP